MPDWQKRGEVLDSDEENEINVRTQPLQDISPNRTARLTSRGDEKTKPISNDIRTQPQDSSLRDDFEDDGDIAAFRLALVASHARNGLNTGSLAHQGSQASSQKAALGSLRDSFDIQRRQESALLIQGSETDHESVTPAHDAGSTSSSPLSDLSSATPEFTELDFQRLVSHLQLPSEPIVESALDAEHRRILQDLTDAAAHGFTHKRNLRQRTTKQMHPFLTERARYLEICKSRGMKPVRIAESRSQVHETMSQEEPDILPDSFDTAVGQTQCSSSASSHHGQEASINVFDEASVTDYGLDPSDHDRGHSIHFRDAVQSGNKRRKVTHPSGGFVKLVRALHNVPHQQDSLPSPTSSLHSTGQVDLPLEDDVPTRFRRPPGMTPALPLPTPDVSSDIRSALHSERLGSRYLDTNAPDAPANDFPSVHTMYDVDTDSEPESVVETSMQQTHEHRLSRERKRIKGVLPASWLRIDMHKQSVAVTKRNAEAAAAARHQDLAHSENLPSAQKGVARRLSKAALHIAGSRVADDFTSDSNSEEDLANRSKEPKQQHLHFDLPHQIPTSIDFPDVDDMEHDWIDPFRGADMSRSERRGAKKRQPKIHEAFGAVPVQSKNGIGASDLKALSLSKRSRALPQSVPRKRQVQKRLPDLSILDVSDRAGLETDFIRIARRRARSAINLGRQSPTNKLVCLHTTEATQAAMQTLTAWEQGTIASTLKQRRHRQRQSRLNTPARINDLHRAPSMDGRASPQSQHLLPVKDIEQSRIVSATAEHLSPTPLAIDRAHRQHFAGHRHLSTRVRPSKNARPALRDAQLEVIGQTENYSSRADAFARRLRLLTLTASNGPDARTTWSVEKSRHANPQQNVHHAVEDICASNLQAPLRLRPREQQQPARSRMRKRRTQRLLVEDIADHAITTEALQDSTHGHEINAVHEYDHDILINLQPIQQPYSIDFGTRVPAARQHFSQSSFVGSGGFAAAIKLDDRDLSRAAGYISLHVNGDIFRWSAWTEEVKSGLTVIRLAIANMVDCSTAEDPDLYTMPEHDSTSLCIDYLLQSLIRYCTHCLYFYDEVDRAEASSSIADFCTHLLPLAATAHGKVMRVWLSILAAQAVKIASNPRVTHESKMNATKCCRKVCHQHLDLLVSHSLPDIQSSTRELCLNQTSSLVTDDHCPITVAVVIKCVLEEICRGSFWLSLEQVMAISERTLQDVSKHEDAWRALFVLLPLSSIGSRGLASARQEANALPSDWSLVQKLLRATLDKYDNTSRLPGNSINQYVRALLHRAYRLVTRWKLIRCETWLATVFDFFAKRGFAPLRKETIHGSPIFLERLSSERDFEPAADDTAYHLFLKILAATFAALHRTGDYSDKKISSMIWRYVPSHGRMYAKETDMERDELDALRNHYDLLCVLYFVSPPEQRIQLDLLEKLIDHSTSHRAACHISIKAWTHLLRYQASLDDSSSSLARLLHWYGRMAEATKVQYRLARSEAEADFRRAQFEGARLVSKSEVEAIVISNQRQISSALVDLLVGFKSAVQVAKSVDTVVRMAETSHFWTLFTDLEITNHNVTPVISEGLDVMQACILRARQLTSSKVKERTNEDSQDFGDASALEEYIATIDGAPMLERPDLTMLLHEPFTQVLSNAFGSEVAPDDNLLHKCVLLWIDLTDLAVKGARKQWQDIIEGLSGSWHQLRHTKQHQLFTPAVYAKILDEADRTELPRTMVVSQWLVSLVARDTSLKFQHEFTTALLNRWTTDPLLFNLPFAKQLGSDCYSISLQDVRQRRVSLLACVLHNMQQDYQQSKSLGPMIQKERRITYATVLQSLMTAMKDNYRDISKSQHSDVADPTTQGSYVDFVHDVINILQEHAPDICAVDKFFTDSSAFPLPASDPSYVVGRLRSFTPRLLESRSQKELAMFLHTSLLRGFSGTQQSQLIEQITTAVAHSSQGSGRDLKLRQFLFATILPAYIDEASRTAVVSSLALPLLSAAAVILSASMYDIVASSNEEQHSTALSLCYFLTACARHVALYSSGVAHQTSRYSFTIRLLEACKSTLAIAQQLTQTLNGSSTLTRCLRLLFEECRLALRGSDGPRNAPHISRFYQQATSGHGLGPRHTEAVAQLPLPDSTYARLEVRNFIDNHILKLFVEGRATSDAQGWTSTDLGVQATAADLDIALQALLSASEITFACPSNREHLGPETFLLAELQL